MYSMSNSWLLSICSCLLRIPLQFSLYPLWHIQFIIPISLYIVSTGFTHAVKMDGSRLDNTSTWDCCQFIGWTRLWTPVLPHNTQALWHPAFTSLQCSLHFQHPHHSQLTVMIHWDLSVNNPMETTIWYRCRHSVTDYIMNICRVK